MHASLSVREDVQWHRLAGAELAFAEDLTCCTNYMLDVKLKALAHACLLLKFCQYCCAGPAS